MVAFLAHWRPTKRFLPSFFQCSDKLSGTSAKLCGRNRPFRFVSFTSRLMSLCPAHLVGHRLARRSTGPSKSDKLCGRNALAGIGLVGAHIPTGVMTNYVAEKNRSGPGLCPRQANRRQIIWRKNAKTCVKRQCGPANTFERVFAARKRPERYLCRRVVPGVWRYDRFLLEPEERREE